MRIAGERVVNIVLEFEYTFADYLEASRTHTRRGRFKDILGYIIVAIPVLALGFTVVDALWLDPKPVDMTQVGGLLIVGTFLFLASPFFFRLMVRKRWNMQPQLHKTITYEVDSDIVCVITETATPEMKWASFSRFVESKNLFLLYPNKLVFHMIPKRAFASANYLESFLELAASKIPPSKRSYPPWRKCPDPPA